jgi:signal transduction histidine kinase
VGVSGAAFGAGVLVIWDQGGPGTLAGVIVLGGALGASRRYPQPTSLVATGALLATALQGPLPLAAYTLVLAHAFCVARWGPLWAALGGLALLIGASEAAVAIMHGSLVPFALLPATAWAAGRALREREQIAARLDDRARDLEHERDTHAALSVRYERARIAAELHDIVAHAITVMVVQAAAGQRLAGVDAELTAQAFREIAGAAREAEADMGRLVSLLEDADAIGAPPDLALVEELIERAAGTGLDVTLRLDGDREGLPAPLVQLAYRVVQESLTNALRYASGAPVRVVLRGDQEALIVEVVNAASAHAPALTGAGTGNGLMGLRDRVAARGGTLDAGPTPDRGWRVSARLPRRVPTPAS